MPPVCVKRRAARASPPAAPPSVLVGRATAEEAAGVVGAEQPLLFAQLRQLAHLRLQGEVAEEKGLDARPQLHRLARRPAPRGDVRRRPRLQPLVQHVAAAPRLAQHHLQLLAKRAHLCGRLHRRIVERVHRGKLVDLLAAAAAAAGRVHQRAREGSVESGVDDAQRRGGVVRRRAPRHPQERRAQQRRVARAGRGRGGQGAHERGAALEEAEEQLSRAVDLGPRGRGRGGVGVGPAASVARVARAWVRRPDCVRQLREDRREGGADRRDVAAPLAHAPEEL